MIKRTLCALILTGSVASLMALPSFLADQPATPQHFVQLDSPTKPASAQQTAAPAIPNQDSGSQTIISPAAPGNIDVADAASMANATANSAVNNSLNRISQSQQLLQQMDMQQIRQLQQQNQALQLDIAKMTNTMSAMNQQVNALGAQVVQLQRLQAAQSKLAVNSKPAASGFSFFSLLHNIYFELTIGAAVLVLLIAAWKLHSRSWQEAHKNKAVKTKVKTAAQNADTNADYDFLNSEDAIPAKLDLARAYIAMDDVSAAQQVLKDVLVQGNAEQKRDAKSLLKQIGTAAKPAS